jgi:diaminopimelate decarboxylase
MSKKRRLASTAALTAFIALAAAGCGSQSHQPSPLVAAADPICQKVNTNSANANAELRKASTSTADTLRVLARVAPTIAAEEHAAVDQLGALKQSGSQTEDWHTLLLGMRELADDSSKLATAAKAKDIAAIHTIVAGGVKIQQKLAVVAEREGFAYCGRTS